MKFCRKPGLIEANQFQHGATAPLGCRSREDGSTYVTTIHGDDITLVPGDWVIMERDGVHAYPCKPDVFEATYEKTNY